MAFDVAAESYDLFMGRFSTQLSSQLADLAGVEPGQRVLDVGCGPGQLTEELVRRSGADRVVAVDPSEPFVEAARARNPGVDVRLASAEDLPFADGTFDAALAQLVVHFMRDPLGGVREMARVTRPGGRVAACVWDLAGGRAPASPFWAAAAEVRPGAAGESGFAGTRAGELREFLEQAGLEAVEETELTSTVRFETFEAWWEPYTLGVGPAGAYARELDAAELEAVRERCRAHLPEPPFALETFAWAAVGAVPG